MQKGRCADLSVTPILVAPEAALRVKARPRSPLLPPRVRELLLPKCCCSGWSLRHWNLHCNENPIYVFL